MKNRENFQQLIDKYLQGSVLTNEEQALLDAYFTAFDKKGAALVQLTEEDKGKIDQTLKLAISEKTGVPIVVKRKRNTVYTAAYRYIGLVAACLLVLSAVLYLFPDWRLSGGYKQVKFTKELSGVCYTSNHSVKQILLPDGSLVFLNKASKLRLIDGFGTKHRKVVLEGEGYFDVAHNPKMPFVVNNGHMFVKVLGTTFVMKGLDTEQYVGLLSGKVELTYKDQQLTLSPGDLAGRHKEINSFGIEQMDSGRLLAWKPQAFEMTNISMSQLADFVAERYGLQLKFENQSILDCRVTTTYNGNETWEELLHPISLVNRFTYIKRGRQVMIIGGGCKRNAKDLNQYNKQ